jgi:hypothetical protein
MNKALLFGGIAFALVSFSSCKHGDKTEEQELGAGMIRMDLTPYGLPATIDIPDTARKPHVIEARPDGSIHISVAKGFDFTINVSGMTMDRKKKDINGDDVDKFQSWVVQDSNTVLYKTQMVNEEFHFYAILKKDGKTFFVEDLRQGPDGNVSTFTQQDAQAMLNAAKTMMPLAAPAKTNS